MCSCEARAPRRARAASPLADSSRTRTPCRGSGRAAPNDRASSATAPRVRRPDGSATIRQLLDRLAALTREVDVKMIQVIRNPFDPISVMMVRGDRTFDNSIEHFFSACNTLVDLRRHIDRGGLLPVRYEDVVADPSGVLRNVCAFVGVDPDPEYIDACTSIIRPRPDRSRDMVEWTPEWIDHVERRMVDFDFLDGYSYDN